MTGDFATVTVIRVYLPIATTRSQDKETLMPRVLVVAANSFIGGHVCRALASQGAEVIKTRRKVDATGEFLSCDLTHVESIRNAVQHAQPEWIIQCGAATASRDARELYQTHVFGTLNLLEAVELHAPQARVLLMGSAAEYGSLPLDWLPLTEDRLPNPSSVFGASKLAQTQMAQAVAAEKRLRVVSVRPFNVIGPGLPDIYFAASLSKRLLAARCAAVNPTEFDVTNVTATRDFVDVRDVAAACIALLERAAFEPGVCEIFNIATSCETTLLEMATLLGELAGGLRPRAAGEHQSRGGIARSAGSYAKLRRATDWEPCVSWQQSLSDLWQSVVAQKHS